MTNMPRLVVEVFEHVNFHGRKVTLVESISNTGEIGAQDIISSIKIYKGPGFNASPNYKAIFHEHENYRGRQLVLAPGFYPKLPNTPNLSLIHISEPTRPY